jgi:hypothetical protein
MTVDFMRKDQLFVEADLPSDAKFLVILGRLFKFHPEFLEMIADLLIFNSEDPDKERLFIVAYAEKTYQYNEDIMESLMKTLQLKKPSFTDSEVLEVLSHFKLLQYSEFYHSLSPFARGMLDSYPYGGKLVLILLLCFISSFLILLFCLFRLCHKSRCSSFRTADRLLSFAIYPVKIFLPYFIPFSLC